LAAAGRLAASVAHEINNPLEAVTNLLYLARSSPDYQIQRYLEQADDELKRITLIAQQTLGFYRDTGRPTLLHVAKVVEEVLHLYAAKLKSHGVKVEKRLASVQLLTLEGELRQILSNIVANAIDAMPRGGRLILKVAQGSGRLGGQGRIRITVADSGCGIQPVERPNIFEAFWTTKGELGTGLGLWVTRSLVEKSGGSIRLRSSVTPGRSGTVVSIFFPDAFPRKESATLSKVAQNG